ncbi:MAG: signal peptidase II [Thermoleophilaceae bacterium]|nr:signal peptidase II [Thermoleophilaceae bacterium]
MSPRAAGWSRVLMTVGVVVAIDQITKAWAVAEIMRGEERNVFFLLDLTHVRNEGVAFGAFAGGGLILVLLIGGALAGLLAYFAANAAKPLLWLPTGMLLGGALGNLADRAREGAVIDFIDPAAWPAFNLADVMIVAGVLLLFYVAEGRQEE